MNQLRRLFVESLSCGKIHQIKLKGIFQIGGTVFLRSFNREDLKMFWYCACRIVQLLFGSCA